MLALRKITIASIRNSHKIGGNIVPQDTNQTQALQTNCIGVPTITETLTCPTQGIDCHTLNPTYTLTVTTGTDDVSNNCQNGTLLLC